MRRARVIVMAIAIFAALAAGLLAYGMMGRPAPKVAAKVNMDTVKVLVASKAIGFGDEVRTADLTWATWPKELVGDKDNYVTEAKNPQGAQYDLDRLCDALVRHGSAQMPSAQKIRDGIIDDVMAWSRNRQDDVTVMVLRRIDPSYSGAA